MAEAFTGAIVPRFWDELRHLSLEARALATYLCTNRHMDGVAGLAQLSMATIADDLNITPEKLQALWAELDEKALGFVEVDRQRRLVRVPNQPKAGHRPNHKVLRAWWRKWQALPDCPMRTAHVLSLAACLKEDAGDATREAWAETFGTVDTSMVGQRLANDGATVREPLMKDRPTVQEPLPNGSSTVSGQWSVVSGQCSLVPEATETTGTSTPRARSLEQGPRPSSPAQVALLPEATTTTTTAGVSELRQVFCAWFLERYARPYAWDGAQAGKAKTLLQRAGEGSIAEIMRRAQRAATQDWRDTDVDLGTVLKGWNALASDASARASPPARDVRLGYVPVTGQERFRDGVVEDF